MKFSHEKFEILPVNEINDTNLDIYYNAYVLVKGAPLSSPIDLTSKDLTLISNQTWITYNNQSNSFEVNTTNNSDAGIYTIVIVQSFAQYPEVKPFTTFNLTLIKSLDPNYVVTQKPPYFVLAP